MGKRVRIGEKLPIIARQKRELIDILAANGFFYDNTHVRVASPKPNHPLGERQVPLPIAYMPERAEYIVLVNIDLKELDEYHSRIQDIYDSIINDRRKNGT